MWTWLRWLAGLIKGNNTAGWHHLLKHYDSLMEELALKVENCERDRENLRRKGEQDRDDLRLEIAGLRQDVAEMRQRHRRDKPLRAVLRELQGLAVELRDFLGTRAVAAGTGQTVVSAGKSATES